MKPSNLPAIEITPATVEPPPTLGSGSAPSEGNSTDIAANGLAQATGTLRLSVAAVGWNRWRKYWDSRRTPAFLLSLILHVVLLLVLATWTVVRQLGADSTFAFQAWSLVDDSQREQVLELLANDAQPPPPNVTQNSSAELTSVSTRAATSSIVETLQTHAPEPAATSSAGALERLLQASEINLSAAFASTAVDGRQPAQRTKVAIARGGTLESEQAVEDALKWLAAHQLPNGAWSLIHDGGACKGQCRNNGSKDRFDTAATGLSLLAFLGAGYTHKEGNYRETVRKGVYFLLQVMEETPQGGSFLYQSDRGMYNHGIAAFALCEAFQLTGDPDLRHAAQQAIDFIVSAQNYRGGWGYLPKQPGDLTLSGWQIMALKSGFAAGLDMAPNTILQIDSFLDSQQSADTCFYGYGKPGKSPTCTAIGLLVRLFRGQSYTDPNILSGVDYFRKVGRSNGDAYFNYYVTLFMFHVGGTVWEDWNPKMREHLIQTQSHAGHEAGSWYFENPYGKEGGRLYTTAMCAMTLEVYYRFAPIYQQADVPFEL